MSSFKQSPPGGLWSIERVVTLLTPVFSAAAGLLVTYTAKIVPGVHLNATDIVALMGFGVTAAASAALKWLHGRQKFTNHAALVASLTSETSATPAPPGAGAAAQS